MIHTVWKILFKYGVIHWSIFNEYHIVVYLKTEIGETVRGKFKYFSLIIIIS